jgi:phosphate uptake regulator
MKRSVIRLGQSTLVLSLPNKWVEENNIKPKTELDVEEEGDTLHVHVTEQSRVHRSVTFEFSEKDWKEPRPEKYFQRMLATAYKQGVATIIVKCTSKKILDYIESRIEGFIGLEIVEQKKGTLTLKTVVEGEDANFDTVMTRALNLTEHIALSSYDALKRHDRDEYTNLLRLERTHNKVTDYLKRALGMRRPTWEDKYIYSFIVEDERLVDEYKYILNNQEKIDAKTLQLLKQANDYLLLLLEMYKQPAKENIMQLSQRYITLRAAAKHNAAKSKSLAALHVYNIIVACYELGETILEWKLR